MSWQRIESSTVDPDITDGLSARVADPLWFLARQFQTGEFRGEDAATPILMTVRSETVPVDRWQHGPTGAAGPIHTHGRTVPLEPIVEAEPHAAGPGSERVGAEAAHQLITRLRTVPGLGDGPRTKLIALLRTNYPLDQEKTSTHGQQDRAGNRRLKALARHLFDGAVFAAKVAAEPSIVPDLLAEAGVPKNLTARMAAAIALWGADLAAVFVIPDAASPWNPSRMEYEFRVGSPAGEKQGFALEAKDYGGGRLDWFSFDAVGFHPREDSVKPTSASSTMLPVPLTYPGQPASRFWETEEGDVYFGAVSADQEDMALVALAAYATVYGDDWWQVPLTVPTGTLARITEVVVLDDFGGRTTVPSSAVLDGPSRVFSFFELTGDASADRDLAPLLFLPPTVQATDAGRPLDDVTMGRDEVANLAWAVEHRVTGSYGRGIDPLAAAAGTGTRSAPPPNSNGTDDRWVFDLGGDVPGNWLPLFPVRLGAAGTVGLQRGRVPVPAERRTRGALSQVLEPDDRLIIEESEVPRAGLRVQRRYQSARTPDGRLRVWLGRQKGPGRPTADGTVSFDVLRGPQAE